MRRFLNKKGIAKTTAMILAVIIIIAAIGAGVYIITRPSAPPVEKPTVTVTMWSYEDVAPWLDPVLEKFNKTRDYILRYNFKRVEWLDFPTAFASAIAAGEKIDIILADPHWAADWCKAGLLKDMRKLLPKEFFDPIVLGALQAVEINNGGTGILPGVPFSLMTAGIWYNKKIFREAGISMPNWEADEYCRAFTIEEFYQVCENLKKAGFEPIGMFGATWTHQNLERICLPMYASNPSDFIIKTMKGEISFRSENWLNIFKEAKRISEYFVSGYAALDEAAACTGFAMGQTAMLFQGVWGLRYITEVAPPDFELGIMPYPYKPPNLPWLCVGGAPAWMILERTPADITEKIVEFLEFLYEDTNLLPTFSTKVRPGAGLPMKTTIMDEWIEGGYFEPIDVGRSLSAMLAKMPTMPWTNEIEGLELSDAISTMFAEVCQGIKTPEQAIEFLAAKYEELKAEGKIIIPTL